MNNNIFSPRKLTYRYKDLYKRSKIVDYKIYNLQSQFTMSTSYYEVSLTVEEEPYYNSDDSLYYLLGLDNEVKSFTSLFLTNIKKKSPIYDVKTKGNFFIFSLESEEIYYIDLVMTEKQIRKLLSIKDKEVIIISIK